VSSEYKTAMYTKLQFLPQPRASIKAHLFMLFREGNGIHCENQTTTEMLRMGQLQS